MRAVQVHEFHGPLRVDQVDEPVAGPDEELVEVEFASVNPLDVWVTKGSFGSATPLPLVPGAEGVGRVDGAAVLVRGQGIGVSRHGLYAERAVVPAKALVPLPGTLDLGQAAGLGVAGLTAWRAVCDIARVEPGDVVVVLGASGGVGSLAVQLASRTGATVIGQTSNEDKAEWVRAQGAERAVVAASGSGLVEALEGTTPTVVLDALGGEFTAAGVQLLAPRGRLVVYGTSSDPTTQFNLRELYRKGAVILTYSGLMDRPEDSQAAFDQLFQAVADGSLSVPVDEVLSLEQAGEAHERVLGRGVRGKLLLQP